MTFDPSELRRITILADLPDERLRELAQHGRELTLDHGEYLFRENEEATFLSLLLDGELETTRSVGGDELPLLHHEPGGFLGAISLVTGGVYGGSTRSVALAASSSWSPRRSGRCSSRNRRSSPRSWTCSFP